MDMLKRLKNEKGMTAVEMALVLPIFALILFAIIDFGRFFFVQHTLQFATREGTRLALVGRTISDGGKALDRTGSILKTIRDSAGAAVDPGALTISIYPVDPAAGYTDPKVWSGVTDPGGPGQYMRVRTNYVYEFFTPFIGQFFPLGRRTIVAEATYRNEMF
jgi:Flp pilus assembly protein TadG